LREIVIKPDPFDLAITRMHQDHVGDLPAIIAARIGSLNAMLTEWQAHATTIDRYLTASEKLVMKHRADRLRAEIAWHEELSEALPKIVCADPVTGDEK
jgi:hypothetical protein